jgi:hypothetical protein
MFAKMQGGSKPGGTQVTAKVQSQDDSHSGSTPVIQDKVKKPFFAGNGLTFDQNFKDVIYYNCGEPCHYVGMCPRPKKKSSYVAVKCITWTSVQSGIDPCQWHNFMGVLP